MKVRYVGPSGTGVTIVHPDPAAPDANTATTCLPGEPVVLPDGAAAELVFAGVFEPVDPPPKARAAKSSTDNEGDG